MLETQIKKYVPSVEDVYQIYNKYSAYEIKEKTRQREIVEHRAMFVQLCLDYTDSTLHYIGNFLGITHSSVIHYKSNFDIFSQNKNAYQKYVRAEQELVNKFPYVYSRYKPSPNKVDLTDVHKAFIRRMHASERKLTLYREIIADLNEKINKYESELYKSE